MTAKDVPGDFDLAYVTFEVDTTTLTAALPLLFGGDPEVATIRHEHYQGDILPHDPAAYWNWLNYMESDRQGVRKGYIVLFLAERRLP
ncbi:MAG: hypothetical protein NTZ05_11100 [Chloroflexi bacterium]|nr:hypothetical protein [Chloroflexota bacterium]